MRRKYIGFLSFCFGLFLGAWPARSATIVTGTYTDLTSWTNAVTEDGDVTFEGGAPTNSFTDYTTSSGYTNQGVQFVGVNGAGYKETIVDPNFQSPYNNWGTGDTLTSAPYFGASLPYIQVNLPAAMTAFSVNLGSISPNAVAVLITLSDGETFTVPTSNRPTLAFFGLTANTAISFIDFSVLNALPGDGTQLVMDNFGFGTGDEATPEAGTLSLIGVGLMSLTFLRRRFAVLG
jgi:hypothetical protein